MSATSSQRRLSVLQAHVHPEEDQSVVEMEFCAGMSQRSRSRAPTSRFASIDLAPPDPILGLTSAFRADPSPCKVNLGVGAYRTETGAPYVLPVVRKVERMLASRDDTNKEYIPIDGLPEFVSRTAQVVLGNDCSAFDEKRVLVCQSLSGTGALNIVAEFLAAHAPETKVYISKPTWGNHRRVFSSAGLEVRDYAYFDRTRMGIDFESLTNNLLLAPLGSAVVFHTCAHNPTGCDLSLAQWEELCDIVQQRQLFPIFDTAYQGFASGDLSRDAMSVRMFVDRGVELFITQSYAKNLGLYGERVGSVIGVFSDSSATECVLSQIRVIVRGMYSSPPRHGAEIVAAILSDPELYDEWQQELKIMSGRIIAMRELLVEHLQRQKCPGSWQHILDQIGMFGFTGLNEAQTKQMITKHHIYLTSDGRISLAGLNSSNVEYVARAIRDVIVETTASD